MDIAIVGRHTKVSDELRDKIEAKMAKLEQLAPRTHRADVTVVHERSPRRAEERERVEITLHGGKLIRSEASAADRHDALDAAIAKLTVRLRRLHERRATRHKGAPSLAAVASEGAIPAPADLDVGEDESPVSVESWEGAPEGAVREIALDDSPIMIREKTHYAEPMTAAQAIDQMELVGHDFFLFIDADTELPSAVYRRRGWTYGVIHVSNVDGTERASA